MKVLFVGSIYDRNEEKKIISFCKGGLPIASNVFQWNIIDGIIENGQLLDIIGSIPIGSYPSLSTKILFKGAKKEYKNCRYQEIGFLNIYPLKHIIRTVCMKKLLRAWIKKNSDEELFVLFYDLYNPFLDVIRWMKRWKNVKSCLIVPDLTGKYRNDMGYSKIKSMILRLLGGNAVAKAAYADSFVLITEQMSEILDINKAPYVVVDGLVRDREDSEIATFAPSEERIVLYAGNLSLQYNIEKMLEVIQNMKEYPELKLWFCGRGNAENLIIEAQQKDERIRYLGLLSKEELHEIEKKVCCFINPRTNNGEYTKYSFPSKNLEYLLASRPVIAYKLEGMSDDYDGVFLYVDDNSKEALGHMFKTICNMSCKEINALGEKGHDFVLKHNGSGKQAEKILNMFAEMTRI